MKDILNKIGQDIEGSDIYPLASVCGQGVFLSLPYLFLHIYHQTVRSSGMLTSLPGVTKVRDGDEKGFGQIFIFFSASGFIAVAAFCFVAGVCRYTRVFELPQLDVTPNP
ncbi:MAG: hypothetical protein MUP25_04650, partial [Syntrophales bacterium]|nr:hypothetical protein [Syntrophales bacterium]